eukprot:gene9264-16954_t
MAKSHGEGFKHKIKSLLGIRKANTIQKAGIENEEEHGFIFSPDVLKEITKENNFGHRARVLKELCEVVSTRKLEEHAAEAVWSEISDMLQPTVPTDARQTTLKFLVCLITGQFQWLGMLRAQFLRLIENHDVKEDLNCRIELLRALTDNGKDVSYCEHFGPFLLRFSRQALTGDRTVEYLYFLINLVHYNSSFLEKDIITELVEQACAFCNKAKVEKEIECCILLLDATVRYGGLPSDGLYPLIATLCRTVNIEKFCQASWKLMKTLVGTRLGHSAIYIMCCILEDENNTSDSILLRGAVFFIGMCVWGSKRVSSLQHKPISLLPSFKQALHCNHPIVAHEIGLSLQRLVKKYGKDLKIVTWDIILDLIDMLIKLLQNLANSNDSLKKTVHDLLTTIEELYSAGRFDGSADRFFAIIERCSAQRPESSVLTLLTFLRKKIDPANDGWLDKLKFVMEKYFRNSKQTAVRVKVLDILSDVMNSYRYWYEAWTFVETMVIVPALTKLTINIPGSRPEEILELGVLFYLSNMEKEKDSSVRLVTAQLLVDLVVTCSSSKCADILAVVKKLINRLMDSSGSTRKGNGEQLITDGEHLRDIKVAVCGLVVAFKQKLCDSSTMIAVKILDILVEHISLHYVNGFTAHSGAIVRLEILKLFLSIRSDESHRVGFLELDSADQSKEKKFSVFATCKRMRGKETAAPSPLGRKMSLTKYCPTYKAFDAVLNCLKDEWEWSVLQFVLQNLPAQLRNKTLILGGDADVSNLCAFLCYMVNDGQFLNKAKNVPPGSGRVELHNLVFPILAVLVTYQNTIERQRQSMCASLRRVFDDLHTGNEISHAADKLYSDNVEKLATEEETNKIGEKFSEASDWLMDDGYDATAEDIKDLEKVSSEVSDWLATNLKEQTDPKTKPALLVKEFVSMQGRIRKGIKKLIDETDSTSDGKKDDSKEEKIEKAKPFELPEVEKKESKPKEENAERLQGYYGLKEVKDLYSNFVEEQYMSIFAIALPYTDAYRYSAYTVTLAHYVISSWFTRCRLAFRKGFVRLITKGLQSSVIIRPSFSQASDKQAGSGKQFGTSEETQVFHEDMKEVCSDMMAKYSFSTLSNQPKRSSIVEFLLTNGLSQSWLVGNTLVTVTTSGSSSEMCVACNQRRAILTANKAAAKLRSQKLNEERRLKGDHQLAEEQESSLSLAVEASIAKASMGKASMTKASDGCSIMAENGIPKESKKGQVRPELMQVSTTVASGEKGRPRTDNKGSDTTTTSFEIKSCEEAAGDRKESRVDSAVEMTEEYESVKEGGLVTAELSLPPEVKFEVSESPAAQSYLPLIEPDALPDETGNEISLVNRLALQEQDTSTGYVFSPTNYFLDEMGSLAETGISATSSMEFLKDQAELKDDDAEDGDNGNELKQEHRTSEDSRIQKETTEMNVVQSQQQSEHLVAKTAECGEALSVHSAGVEKQERTSSKEMMLLPGKSTSDVETQRPPKSIAQKGKVDSPDSQVPRQLISRLEQDAPALGYNEGLPKQSLLRAQPVSTNVSQNSSLQASPATSKKTSFQNSVELSSEFEMVDEADAASFSRKESSSARSLPNTICNCSSDGWAEIVIRRPTGNTSWVIKIENVLHESDTSRIEDITALAAAVEAEDYTSDIRKFYDSPSEEVTSTRPRFMSVVTDELSKERQAARSSSDSPKPFSQDISSDSPSSFRRRRFSTGSMDISGTFRFSSPSPDVSKEKDALIDASYAMKYNFEKPSLGLSPLSPLKRHGSANSVSDIKEKRSDFTKEFSLSSSYRGECEKPICEPLATAVPLDTVNILGKSKLSKTLSGPATTSASSQTAVLSSLQNFAASKDKEMQKLPAAHDKENREAPVSKFVGSKNVGQMGSLIKDESGVSAIGAQEPEASKESQRELQKKGPLKLEPQKQLKEPLKAGAQALKERISSFSTYRPRGKTISAYPVSKIPQTGAENKDRLTLPDKGFRASLNPYFVFLQFFYSPFVNAGGSGRPLLLGCGEVIDRAVRMLDRIPPYDHHKIGVLYVGPDQESNETAILANQFGSHRYLQFLSGLGKLTSLLDCSYTEVYTGGLDRNGEDGKFAYSWRDDITQGQFQQLLMLRRFEYLHLERRSTDDTGL